MEKVKFTKELADALKNQGDSICTGGNTYYRLPFCYKETDDSEVFECFHRNELPEDLKAELPDFFQPHSERGYFLTNEEGKTEWVADSNGTWILYPKDLSRSETTLVLTRKMKEAINKRRAELWGNF